MATLQENINQAINDFNNIKQAIIEKGVGVPNGTPTSQYGESIRAISTGVDTSQDTVVAAALRAGFTAHEASGAAITGTIQNYEGAIVSGATPGAQAKYEEGYADGQASMPDLSKDTVTPDKLVLGETAHDASGAQITGILDTEAIRAEGVEAGKKSEYDAFWDAFQEYGNRTNYNMAFAGVSWSPEMLKPKYPIHPNDGGRAYSYEGARIFERFGKKKIDGNALFDWKEITANMDIDLSSVSHPISLFANANITNIDVDLSGAESMSQTFAHSDCGCTGSHGALSIRFKVTEKCKSFSNTFSYSSMLTELILTDDSTIAGSGFDVSWSPLSKASLTSIVNALSTTTTGLTVTLRLDAVNTAFETAAGAADGSTSEEWLALAATKPNWTINLINS